MTSGNDYTGWTHAGWPLLFFWIIVSEKKVAEINLQRLDAHNPG
jgi:hypothetical protein